MSTLTIINIKNGEVSTTQMDNLAGGQVLLKNCTDAFIVALVKSVQKLPANTISTQGTTTYDPREIQMVKNRLAAEKTKANCCGSNSCQTRPTEDQVAAALALFNTAAPKTTVRFKKKQADKKASLPDLLDEDEYIDLHNLVKGAKECCPTGKISRNEVCIVYALAVKFPRGAFSAGQAVDAISDTITADRSVIRRISLKYPGIIEHYSGRLAATKYCISKDFYDLLLNNNS